MYELARGPLLWFAAAVFVLGIIYRIIELFTWTEKRERVPWPTRNVRVDSPEERRLRPIILFRHSLIGKHPVMALASAVFHLCLLGAPLLAKGHALLLRQFWGIPFPNVSSSLTEVMTLVVLAGAVFLVVRRIAVPRVRAVSGLPDFAFLFVAAAPYLTGVLAYHQWFEYRTILTIHMLAGELMLIAIPFTKLSHMVFFFFVRAFVESEHSVGRGERVWSA
jgi:nitrate reductase gamma subunit